MRSADFLRVPVNMDGVPWRTFRLYVKFLDMKAQNPDEGTFKIYHSKRSYQKAVKEMVERGWAFDRGRGIVKLRAYPAVWDQIGIQRLKRKNFFQYRYFKIPIEGFSSERPKYLKEIETAIRKKMAKRKGAQIRRALSKTGNANDRATFAGMSAALLFGYQSPATGTKLRQKYFEVIPQKPEETKRYILQHPDGSWRWRDKTREIAL